MPSGREAGTSTSDSGTFEKPSNMQLTGRGATARLCCVARANPPVWPCMLKACDGRREQHGVCTQRCITESTHNSSSATRGSICSQASSCQVLRPAQLLQRRSWVRHVQSRRQRSARVPAATPNMQARLASGGQL